MQRAHSKAAMIPAAAPNARPVSTLNPTTAAPVPDELAAVEVTDAAALLAAEAREVAADAAEDATDSADDTTDDPTDATDDATDTLDETDLVDLEDAELPGVVDVEALALEVLHSDRK